MWYTFVVICSWILDVPSIALRIYSVQARPLLAGYFCCRRRIPTNPQADRRQTLEIESYGTCETMMASGRK
jgi:hypothetical protein